MSTDPAFEMRVEDIFLIRGRGMVVVGSIKSGVLKVGDIITVRGQAGSREVKVAGLEMFGKKSKEARAGERIGVLLDGIAENEIEQGDRLEGPGSGMDYSWKP